MTGNPDSATTAGTNYDGESSPADRNTGVTGGAHPERPRALPLIGHLHQITRDPLGFFDTARGHDLMTYRMFTDRCYVVAHPEGVRSVLVENDGAYRKGAMMRGQTGSLLGDGIFLAEGEDWQGQRTTMQPAFYRERVAGYASAMVEHANTMADGWDHGEVVDVADRASDLTLAILADTLLGIDPGTDREVVARAADAIAARYDSRRVGAFLPEWLPSPTNRRYRRALAELRQAIDRIIRDRRAALAEDDPGTDLLSMLVAATADGGMDDTTLRDNVVTFLFAGHETTALGLTYALFSLANAPDAAAAVRDELAAFGDPTVDPAAAAAPDALPAVDRVVSETLRLYPPVHVFFREPARTVEVCGTRVSAGTVLALSPWTCHHDPRWWTEPGTFRPDRWTNETQEADARPEYAYFPFGGGPRHCIGMRFARLELRLALATVLSRYRLEAVTEDLSFAPSATLQPDGPVRVRFLAR